jgi:peptide/nickel transport system permease protein
MQLLRFITRRLLFQILVLLGLTLLTFSLMFLLPGDPAAALLTIQGVAPDRDTIEAFNRRWGLDRPLHEQYLVFVTNVLRGDLGQSMVTKQPIAKELMNYFPATVELALAATVVAVLIGIPMGVLAAVRRGGVLDQIIRVVSLFGVSMPIFWLAILALTLLYGKLGIVPSSQRIPITLSPPPAITHLYLIDYLLAGNPRGFLSALHHLALPALLLGYSVVGLITRITRANMLDVLSQDYIRTARAKGLGDRLVLYRHALRNAMIPTVTALGLAITSLLSGAVLTETIFAWPGLGRFAVQSIFYLDRASVMGITLLIGVVVSVVNLGVDLLVAALDPRIHYS